MEEYLLELNEKQREALWAALLTKLYRQKRWAAAGRVMQKLDYDQDKLYADENIPDRIKLEIIMGIK